MFEKVYELPLNGALVLREYCSATSPGKTKFTRVLRQIMPRLLSSTPTSIPASFLQVVGGEVGVAAKEKKQRLLELDTCYQYQLSRGDIARAFVVISRKRQRGTPTTAFTRSSCHEDTFSYQDVKLSFRYSGKGSKIEEREAISNFSFVHFYDFS